MKIYSWNMLFQNRHSERALAFIRATDFDVFCLQEVPETFLARLKTLSCFIAVAPEVDRLFKGERSTQYVVILSRFPIISEGRIPLPYREPMLPLRSRLFVQSMMWLRFWALGLGNRHSLFADLATPNGALRVFNLHLPLATPVWREEEFELAMLESNTELPTVVCGDFNILEKPHITPLTWILGGTLGDALLARRERRRVEALFASYQLSNPLRGKSTHAISRSQLDHILVSRHFSAVDADVLADSCGSDHRPIFVEVVPAPRTSTP